MQKLLIIGDHHGPRRNNPPDVEIFIFLIMTDRRKVATEILKYGRALSQMNYLSRLFIFIGVVEPVGRMLSRKEIREKDRTPL